MLVGRVGEIEKHVDKVEWDGRIRAGALLSFSLSCYLVSSYSLLIYFDSSTELEKEKKPRPRDFFLQKNGVKSSCAEHQQFSDGSVWLSDSWLAKIERCI